MLHRPLVTLDRGVRSVDVHIDDEFELVIIGHAAAVEYCYGEGNTKTRDQ